MPASPVRPNVTKDKMQSRLTDNVVSVRTVLVLICLSLSPRVVQPQSLQIGDRVRLTAPVFQGTRGIGVVTAQSASDLTLSIESSATPLVLPWSSITAMGVRKPRTKRQGAIRAAAWGFVIGMTVATVAVRREPGDPFDEYRRKQAVVTKAGTVGLWVGALIGVLKPGHRWQTVGIPAAQYAAAGPDTGIALVSAVDLPAPAVDSPAPTRAHATSVETTLGANLPQYFGAQFPGLNLSVALSRAIARNKGIGLVGEADASYLRFGLMGGPRFYLSDGPLFAKSTMLTAFTQVLFGRVFGGESGVFSSTGGPAIQPGVGVHLGDRARVFHLQVDYRIVRGGFVYDLLAPGQHTDRATGPRVLVGITFRARSK